MVGSGIWRLVNYGPLATLRYLVSKLIVRETLNNSLKTLSLGDALSRLEIADLDIESVYENNSRYLEELRCKMLSNQNSHFKPVLSSDATISRLLLLDIFIRNFGYDCVIETGTQHGVSAYVMSQVASEIPGPPKLITYDVVSTELISTENNVEYVKLNTPVRKNFMNQSKKLIGGKLLFFHDSDHSYENMTFEFDFAWNVLLVETIISDDIDGNTAFEDFVAQNKIQGFRIKLDNGPALGIASRRLT